MKKLLMGFLLLMVIVGILSAGGTQDSSSEAGEFPNRPIQIIVPWGAGGRTDINARMFASVIRSTAQNISALRYLIG